MRGIDELDQETAAPARCYAEIGCGCLGNATECDCTQWDPMYERDEDGEYWFCANCQHLFDAHEFDDQEE